MPRGNIKREIDLQTMSQWIVEGDRVLDIGCGKGVFLEYLMQTRNIYGIGIDHNLDKIRSCVKRGVNAYQGDATQALKHFSDNSFDWIICSRMLHELNEPYNLLRDSLRVAKNVAVGFVNFGFWETRLSILTSGQRPKNEVYPNPWHTSKPANPLTIKDFENFCKEANYQVQHRVYLDSSWRTPVSFCPNLLAGYAVYAISK